MARNTKTAAEVEMEIARLKNSEDVRLAQKYQRLKTDRLRKQMYQLSWQEKVGKELRAQGITLENIEEKLFSDSPEEDTEESVE